MLQALKGVPPSRPASARSCCSGRRTRPGAGASAWTTAAARS
jgi:hypothetical protein